MPEFLHKLKREQFIGLLLVLALHGAALYGLWVYRIVAAAPAEEQIMMVNLVNQPKPAKPKPHPKHRPVEPPKPRQPVVEAPAVVPDEAVAIASPPPPAPQPAEAPPMPPRPVALPAELSVNCPERAPPDYPARSMRMNEQGKVVLRVELGEDGRVVEANVKTSSGYHRLDEAALDAVKTWRCRPQVRNGVPVRTVALQPFDFILEGL
ncbi:MAG: energy transducer TonB [Burkholderiales bacterium]|nr:energy transducer TonB [Burkholderiales bacterium]